MSIRRAKRKDNFTIINNNVINDERLSFKARGLLVYMLSKPDDWTFYETQMATVGPDGRDSVRSAINEIEKAGYLVKDKPKRDSNGKFQGKNWILYDKPQNVDITTISPSTENPRAVNPADGKPGGRFNRTPVNPTLLSTESLSTESLSTESLNTDNNNQRQKPADDGPGRFNFVTAWEKAGFGLMNGFQRETLIHWQNDFNNQEEIICQAIEAAAMENPRSPLKYVESILRNWERDGIKTASDVRAKQAERERIQKQTEAPAVDVTASQYANFLNEQLQGGN